VAEPDLEQVLAADAWARQHASAGARPKLAARVR
jgi:hypothetical protein